MMACGGRGAAPDGAGSEAKPRLGATGVPPVVAGVSPATLEGETPSTTDETSVAPMRGFAAPHEKLTLNTQRLGSVIAALKNCGAKRVIDIGCGEGHLLQLLVKERQFTDITGVDVSHFALARAADKLKLERASDSLRERIQLIQGSLTYKDARFGGYDAACVVEVVEHLDIARLAAFERVLFEFAKPPAVVLTTPNREYNANYENLLDGDKRHSDHRFEWTRAEFRDWAAKVAERFGYTVQHSEIGDMDKTHGAPTQMAVFTCA